MVIRDYEAGDRDACIEIFDSNTPFFFDPSERQYLLNWLDAKDQKRHAYPGNQAEYFYVLAQNDRVLACGGFYVAAGEKRVNVVWGMVMGVQRKKGLGGKLMDYRIEIIKELYPGFVISLDTTQHSFEFFKRFDFSLEKIIDNHYGPGLDAYFMSMRL